MSEEQKQADNRKRPTTEEFRAFVAEDWAPRATKPPALTEAARRAGERRAAVSAAHEGERLVIPAGGLKVRSNDTDYVFRPHSAFAHLTGLGADREPDAVLVMEPLGGPDEQAGHDDRGTGDELKHDVLLGASSARLCRYISPSAAR